ncbi:hypothetical protein [Tateyamaria sp. ANG-S1]|uniref:hypothetical protein n=1 Tax=Tateyamaria sp. ANG-S1 TaxID=1577905 RepID=UPI00126A054D|nr:hypothetical protein [Tateyamaria sp. ANG-S1]
MKLRELSVNCGKVLSKQVPKVALEPIVNEVVEALKSDKVVHKILSNKGVPLSSVTPKSDETTEEILSRTRLAISLITPSYSETCEKVILENCGTQGSKRKLLLFTKLYIAHLCGQRFHRMFIHETAIEHFTRKTISRCTSGLLTKFFNYFTLDKNRYFTVALCGSATYVNFLNGVFQLETYDDEVELKGQTKLNIPSDFAQGDRKKILLLPGIRAPDRFSAVVWAEKLLGISRSFLFVFPSSLKESIDNDAYVFHGKSLMGKRVGRRLTLSVSTSRATRPQSVSSAAKAFSRFAFENRNGGRGDDGLFRALNAAALSGSSQDPETQLITLWSAFEALLPQPTRDEKGTARIVHFCSLIVPALASSYIPNKFEFFVKSLDRARARSVRKIIEAHGHGDSDGERLAFTLSASADNARLVASALDQSPLLINRVSNLYNLSQSPTEALRKLNANEDRLMWQLHRIYRERNDIVHSGTSSPFLLPVTENAFFYFRVLTAKLESIYAQFEVTEPHGALQIIAGIQSELKQQASRIVSDREISEEQKRHSFIEYLFKKRAI